MTAPRVIFLKLALMDERNTFEFHNIRLLRRLVSFLRSIYLHKNHHFSLFDLIEMYVVGIFKGALTTRAGSIAFSFFMALSPFLLFVLNLIPFVPIAGFEVTFKLFLESLLPVESLPIFDSIYEGVYDKRRGGLLSSAFLLSIFFMGNGIHAIFGGFEESYHVEMTRNFFKQYLYALGVGLLLAFILLLAVAGFLFFEVYVMSPETGGKFDHTLLRVPVLQYVFFVFISYITSACLYYFGTAEVNTLRFFSPGALMSCALIVLTTFLFGLYIEYFSSYNKLYGSIGALLILMLYIWLNAIILLLGFELNAVINKFNKIK